MDIESLIRLVRMYPEFVDDLDEMGCDTGLVHCPICDGGGAVRRVKCVSGTPFAPVHRPNCPRLRFEEDCK